ncbi:uncharacterized protein [Diadema antillarum]|uniref:uncharacterized protein n=1 Tax=Diadema antillarum TaxID=105358 RepID=UPI003A870479
MMMSVWYLIVCCILSAVRSSTCQQANRTLASCSFENTENCGFEIVPDLNGVHHLELWTLSMGGKLGRNAPRSDHTPESNLDWLASTKSLESTSVADFNNFTTVIVSPSMNFSTGRGHVTFYYFLWITDDPEGNQDTYPTLTVKGCDEEMMWRRQDFTTGWQVAAFDFTCSEPGLITFEALHQRPGSGVAIDDVKIIEIPNQRTEVTGMDPSPTLEIATRSPISRSSTSPDTSRHTDNTTTESALSDSTGIGEGRVLILAAGCLLGAALILTFSIAIHCCFWRKKRRAEEDHITSSNGGLQVSNTGYDFLTTIVGINNGLDGSKTIATESTTLSTIGKGSSYQMDILSVRRVADDTFEKRLDGSYGMPSKGKRRSITLASFKRVRSSRDRSFEYSEIPESTSPTDENVYHFATLQTQQSNPKAPKLGVIGRTKALVRSNSLPSRNSTESCVSIRMEGPYHITDLIGNVGMDNAIFPSMETVIFDEVSSRRKSSVKYDQPLQNVPQQTDPNANRYEELNKSSSGPDLMLQDSPKRAAGGHQQAETEQHVYKELETKGRGDWYDLLDHVSSTSTSHDINQSETGEHVYKALEHRQRDQDNYDLLQSTNLHTTIQKQDSAKYHVYNELQTPKDQDNYDLLEPESPQVKQAHRDLSDYENPPAVGPKPASPFAPRPMSPRHNWQLPSAAQRETAPPAAAVDQGPEGFVMVRDPKYYTLVPDIVRDASYEYPAVVFQEIDGFDDDDASDTDSNAYESFERPITPKDRRQSLKSKSASNDRAGEGLGKKSQSDPAALKQQQLAKFLDDDYENIE